MATHPSYFPSELDARGPNFHAKCVLWRAQMRTETVELIALTKRTISETRELLTEVDRLLALR